MDAGDFVVVGKTTRYLQNARVGASAFDAQVGARDRGGAAQHGSRLAVDKAAVAHAKRRVGEGDELGVVVGGDGQRCRVDGAGVVGNKSDVVVARHVGVDCATT